MEQLNVWCVDSAGWGSSVLLLTPTARCSRSSSSLSSAQWDSSVLPEMFCYLQAKCGCRSAHGAARVGSSGSCGEICAACIIPESLGRSLKSTASCKREKLNRGSRAIARCEMLHSGGAELACTVLHCRERQSCSKKQFSFSPWIPIVRDYYTVKPFWKINGVLNASPFWWIWAFPPVKRTALTHKFSCSADPSLCHVCWKGNLKEAARKVSSL